MPYYKYPHQKLPNLNIKSGLNIATAREYLQHHILKTPAIPSIRWSHDFNLRTRHLTYNDCSIPQSCNSHVWPFLPTSYKQSMGKLAVNHLHLPLPSSSSHSQTDWIHPVLCRPFMHLFPSGNNSLQPLHALSAYWWAVWNLLNVPWSSLNKGNGDCGIGVTKQCHNVTSRFTTALLSNRNSTLNSTHELRTTKDYL